jgi:hypothetical protein
LAAGDIGGTVLVTLSQFRQLSIRSTPAMKELSIFFLLLLSLIASPSQAGNDLIELTIQCPYNALAIDINWKNHLDGGYSDTGGKSGTLDFEVTGGSDVITLPFQSVVRDGQKIRCSYHGIVGGGHIGASYAYTVNREIVSCWSTSLVSRGIKCTVKP